MDAKAELIKKIQERGISCREADLKSFGYDIKVDLSSEDVRSFAALMLENGMYLVFVSGLHISPDMVVTYEMASFECSLRVSASVAVSKDGKVPTISDIYHGAAWHERETRDFFGIEFEGNSDMRPLLLMETDVDFHPLLKKDGDLKSMESVTWAPVPEKSAVEKPA